MSHCALDPWGAAAAERAFAKALRSRRRSSALRKVRRGCVECARLAIHEACTLARSASAGRGLREIPLDAITGSVEPNRAALFDNEFRPAAIARGRWMSVWQAEQSGAGLPPISVVPIGDGFAIRDGHHRVSVARARGAASIAALVA
jgi:hypothetical protein